MRKSGGRTAFARWIRPAKTDSLALVESGAAMMEGMTAREAHDVEPRRRPVVRRAVLWARVVYVGLEAEVDMVIL